MAPANGALSEPIAGTKELVPRAPLRPGEKKERSLIRQLEPGTNLGCVRVGRSLGSGSFGCVYAGSMAIDEHGVEVAIKVCDAEPMRVACLQQEAEMLTKLWGVARVPMLFHCFCHRDLFVIVLNLLGPSLEEHWERAAKKIGTKKVGHFARQLISALRHVHNRSIIHRDVKPQNILLDPDDDPPQLCLVDFGLATFYRKRKHLPYSNKQNFVGSSIYASVNAHSHIRLSRRDDMESLFYSLMFLLVGPLPWHCRKVRCTDDEFVQHKASDKVQALCEPFEACWFEFFGLCRNLQYTEEPNYDGMRSLMKSLDTRDDASHSEISNTSISSFDFDCKLSSASTLSQEDRVPAERWEHKLSL